MSRSDIGAGTVLEVEGLKRGDYEVYIRILR